MYQNQNYPLALSFLNIPLFAVGNDLILSFHLNLRHQTFETIPLVQCWYTEHQKKHHFFRAMLTKIHYKISHIWTLIS